MNPTPEEVAAHLSFDVPQGMRVRITTDDSYRWIPDVLRVDVFVDSRPPVLEGICKASGTPAPPNSMIQIPCPVCHKSVLLRTGRYRRNWTIPRHKALIP